MRLPSIARTALVTLLGLGAVACGTASEDSSSDKSATTKSSWTCGASDVPGGQVMHCAQGLVIDETIPMDTETCSGITDNPEECSSYECNAGDANCPPVDTSSSTDGSSDSVPSDTTDTTGTTGSGTSDTTGMADNLGGSDCTKNNCNAPGVAKKDGSGSGSSTTTDSSTTPGNGNGNGGNGNGASNGNGNGKKLTECAYVDSCSAGASDASSADSSSSSTGTTSSSTSDAPKHYKCTTDKKGKRSCTSAPSCLAGSHASACGACIPDGSADDCQKPTEGGCWVTGGGFIQGPNLTTGAAPDGHDSFGGNAKPMKSGRIQGHWNHVDHGTGNHAKGVPSYIVCRHLDEPGPGGPGAKKGFIMNQVYFGGPAQWRVAADGVWSSGYWFDVVAKDHGEPGSVPSVKNGFTPDTYHFTIRKQDDVANQASGTIVYETKETLDGGNIQMHPPVGGHPYTPGKLPNWVSLEP